MNLWHDIKSKKLIAVIEIPKGSRNKYEISKKTGKIRLSRILSREFRSPLNYGFIPRTLTKDNDPLDIMVLGRKLVKKRIIKINPIAILKIKDQDQLDDKILAIPIKDSNFKEFKTLKDVPKALLNEIVHFFKHYKDLEHKKVKVIKWQGKKEAIEAVKKAQENYKNVLRLGNKRPYKSRPKIIQRRRK